ncbi:hypothetical protein ACEYYA_01040 [Paracoccus sp. p3-h83]|uniref:hypothetical protein n=1 Tax=Paracoccus sp. p3-h83 TaxID=3342805 RepID=UPI0035B8753D
MSYFRHITCNTGRSVNQYRTDISDVAISRLSDALDIILTGGTAQIVDGYTLTGTHAGTCLIATLWAVDDPILTMAVALRQRGSDRLWEAIHRGQSNLPTFGRPPPRAPWIADRVEPTASRYPDALQWTGDLSRCLAWAWHEYRRAPDDPGTY